MDGMIGKKKPDSKEQIDAGVRLDEIDQQTLDDIVGERDQLRAEQDRILRGAADAQNRLRTARKDVQESNRQGVTAVARDVIAALDSFDLALSQDMHSATVESIVEGVRSIRGELIRALSYHGVSLIEATPGEELDPQRHQAMMEQPSDEFDGGQVVAMVQVGYKLNDRVIRPAKVIVAASRAGGDCDVGCDDLAAEDNSADSLADETNPGPAVSEGTPDPDGVFHIDDESLGDMNFGEEPDEGPPETPREDGHADV